ncbi:hypothetical protein [Noviherbaspirillum aerium]|uniref:hypothetical protein n=1 Tax=Noviherbaspirillum aerium TaxID=2588497 RepID=UPI001CEF995F|nr:hypothetical protein [Noviherbaspirillum aerium]
MEILDALTLALKDANICCARLAIKKCSKRGVVVRIDAPDKSDKPLIQKVLGAFPFAIEFTDPIGRQRNIAF